MEKFLNRIDASCEQVLWCRARPTNSKWPSFASKRFDVPQMMATSWSTVNRTFFCGSCCCSYSGRMARLSALTLPSCFSRITKFSESPSWCRYKKKKFDDIFQLIDHDEFQHFLFPTFYQQKNKGDSRKRRGGGDSGGRSYPRFPSNGSLGDEKVSRAALVRQQERGSRMGHDSRSLGSRLVSSLKDGPKDLFECYDPLC